MCCGGESERRLRWPLSVPDLRPDLRGDLSRACLPHPNLGSSLILIRSVSSTMTASKQRGNHAQICTHSAEMHVHTLISIAGAYSFSI